MYSDTNDYDYSYDLDENYVGHDDSESKIKGRKKSEKAKLKTPLDTRPKMKQIEGKVVRMKDSNMELGFQTADKLYHIEMNETGKALEKLLYCEILAYGIERKEGKKYILTIHNYL